MRSAMREGAASPQAIANIATSAATATAAFRPRAGPEPRRRGARAVERGNRRLIRDAILSRSSARARKARVKISQAGTQFLLHPFAPRGLKYRPSLIRPQGRNHREKG